MINSIEQALLSTIQSSGQAKFNGNLETTPTTQGTELDKLNFIKQLKRKVQLHGQQMFYAVFLQDEVLSLFNHYHKFTVEEIIAQYELQCDEPEHDIDPVTQQDEKITLMYCIYIYIYIYIET